MAILQQIFGTPPLPAHTVGDGETIIGRQEDCEIVLDSPAVSRQHARISNEDGHYFLEDLNSRNGTLLNGQPVTKKTLLKEGDQVEVSTLPFTFLTQNTLSELSGSWGIKPDVISISQTGSEIDESIRRRIVHSGDRISKEQLGSDSLRTAQVVARVQVADGGGGWPVINGSVEKLNHVLRTFHSLRRRVQKEEVLAQALKSLFEMFPGGERIAVVNYDRSEPELRVTAAVAREHTEEIEICLPVVRTAIQNTEAILYVDYLRNGDQENAEPVMRNILVAPLVDISGDSFGAIQLDSHQRQHSPGKDDLEKLVIVCHVISYALEMTDEIRQLIGHATEKHVNKLAIHLREQMSPQTAPVVPGFQLEHCLMATPAIAADLVDYVRLPDGRAACVLIDVPGRGAEAVALMTLLSRFLSEAVCETGAPAAAIRRTSALLRQRLDSVPQGISVAVAIVDPIRGSLTTAVAGRCPIVVLRDGQASRDDQDCSGDGLADVNDDSPCSDVVRQMSEEEVVIIFSDGILQLPSVTGEIMDGDTLLQDVELAGSGNRALFSSTFGGSLQRFRGQAALPDDVAMMIIRRTTEADASDASDVPQLDSETFGL